MAVQICSKAHELGCLLDGLRADLTALAKAHNCSDPEDAVQDFICSIIEKPTRLRSSGNCGRALIFFAAKRFYWKWRRPRIAATQERLELSELPSTNESPAATPGSGSGGRSTTSLAQLLLAHLSPSARAITWRYCALEEDDQSIAADLGVSPKYVRACVSKVKKQLRARLDELFSDGDTYPIRRLTAARISEPHAKEKRKCLTNRRP